MRSVARFAVVLAVSVAALVARPSHAQLLQNELLWKINETRAAHGLARLTPIDDLTMAASFLAGDSFRNNLEGHIDSFGRDGGQRLSLIGYSFSSWGEIVGHSWSNGTPEYLWTNDQMLEWWMNSPPHRANILNPGFTEVGIGVSNGGFREVAGQRVFHRYWCVVFGSR
jgi:uncharacterized protein YkwD